MLCEKILGKLKDFDLTGKTVEMLNTMAEYMRDFTVAFDKVALPKIK